MPAIAGLQNPVDIANARDGSGRLFIAEQSGRVRIAKSGQLTPTPFIDLTALVQFGGEQGLLGLAFHPLFRDNGLFFVNYTRREDGATVVARVDGDYFAVMGLPLQRLVRLLHRLGLRYAFGPVEAGHYEDSRQLVASAISRT